MLRKLGQLYLLFIYSFFFTALQGGAQSFPTRNYTVADGLPSNTVYCVYKDSRGILWFGSDKGIARYNGVKFEKFSTADGLPDNEIFGFSEDKYHRLWMATFNGNLCYYKDGIIHTAANTPFLRLKDNYALISSIYTEYDSSITICFANSNYFLNIVGEQVHTFNISSLKKDTWGLKQIAKISPSEYQVTYDQALGIWDTSGNASWKTPLDVMYTSVICNDIRYLVSFNKIYRDNRFICNIPRHESLKIFAVFEEQAQKQVLMGTSKGLFIFPGNKVLFRNSEVSAISKDTLGNYWLTTTNAGAFCLAAGEEHFANFNSPDKGRVTYARILNNQLYFCTDKGNIYTLQQDSIRKLFDGFAYKDEYIKANPFFYRHIFDFFPPKKEAVTGIRRKTIENRDAPYVSYLDDSLHFYHFTSWDYLLLDRLQSGKAHVAYTLPIEFSGAFKNIAVTRDVIYIKAYMDILYIPKIAMQKQDWSLVRTLRPHWGKHERLFGWAKDASGNVWLSTVDSLYKIQNDTVIAQRGFGAIGLRKFCLLNGFLIGYKHNNTLLVAHLDHQKLVTDTTIIPNSILDNFYQIDSTHVVLSSSDKYYMVTLTKPGTPNGFRIQTVESRFIPPQADYICADTNVCYFFKSGTISRYDTKSLFNATIRPVVYFVSLHTKDSVYALNTNAISIPYRETGDLQINYLPLSYSGGDLQCEYSVSQDGSDEWHVIDETNIHLFLTHYGTYNIRIRAKSLSDQYSNVAGFQLTIIKPFWATWWFIALSTVVALLLLWMIIAFATRRVVHRRQKAYEADMKYQRMEFKALNALMNPHFIFNTLNNIQNLFKNNGNRADEYFVTFARLIRQNMQNVTKDTISLEQELNLVANYLKLEKLRFDEFVNYKMDVDPELDLDNVYIPPLLIQPLVENAIRHGLLPKQSTDNFVSVHVHEKGKSLFIEIEDNGVGLSGKTSHIDPQHESLGLSNLRKRIEHMNRTRNEIISFDLIELKDEKGRVCGTLARIEIASERWK